MFNSNLMLAQAIQRDHLRTARRDNLARQFIEMARQKLFARSAKKQKK